MRISCNKVLLSKITLLLMILLLGGLTSFGCIRGLQSIGWSGGVAVDGTLFLGSMEGKLVAVDIADDIPSHSWSEALKTTAPTNRFGCAGQSTSVAIYGTPSVVEDLAYVGGYNGRVYAFDSSSLQKRWVYPAEGNLQPIVSGPVVALGKLYIGGSDGKVYALNADTGIEMWEPFQTGDKIWATPVIDGTTLYVSSFDRKLYALNANTGEKKWETVEAGGSIVNTPIVYGNSVYFSSLDRHLYAVDAADGSLQWKSEIEADSWFWAKPVIYRNTIYAPSLDGKVYILDADNGREFAEAIELEELVSSSPVLVGDSIIIASEEGRIYSLDTANNQIKPLADVKEKVNAPLYADSGVLYIHTQENDTLHALNAQTGTKLWDLSLSNE